MATGTVLLIDGSLERRQAIRRALERRGYVVSGEAGSVPEVIDAVAACDVVPGTVLVGSDLAGSSSEPIAQLIKRTWPKATVIHEAQPAAERGYLRAVGA